MILKIIRQKFIDNGKQGSTELITEIYSGKNYIQNDNTAEIGDIVGIPLSDYDQVCDITNGMVHYTTLNAYLMNDEGKTIEKII